MDLGELKVRISADIAQLSAGLQRAQARVQMAGEKMQSVGRGMQSVGAKMSLGITAPLLLMGKIGVEELGSIEAANAQTAASLKRIGPASLVSVSGVQKLAGALQLKSGIDDQVIQSGANMLLTLGSIDTKTKQGKKTFETATKSMVDFAEATGTNAAGAGKLYAKSLAAANAGTLLLPRGVKLSADAMAKLTAEFNAAKTPGERQALVADALGKKFAGAAKLTSTEKWAVLQDQLAGLAAGIVAQLMPAVTSIAGKLGEWTAKFDSLSPGMKKTIAYVALFAAALGPLLVIIGTIVTALGALAVAEWAAILPIAGIIAAVVAVIAIGVLLYKNWDLIKQKAAGVWDWILEFLKKHAVLIATVVLGPIGGLVVAIIKHWDQIKAKTVSIWNAIKDAALKAVTSIGPGLQGAAAAIPGLLGGALAKVLDKARSVGADLRDDFLDRIRAIGAGLAGAAGGIAGKLDSAFDAAVAKAKAIGEQIKDAVLSAVRAIPNAIRSISLPSIDIQMKEFKIPKGPSISVPSGVSWHARGGIFGGPTVIGVGEAGREAVVPLGNSAQNRSDRASVMAQAGLTGGGITIASLTINANDAAGGRQAADAFMSALQSGRVSRAFNSNERRVA